MTAGTDISAEIGGGQIARPLVVLLLFALSLAFLALAGLILIPDTGAYEPNGVLRNLAALSALLMVVVAIPERESRRLLAVLLGALGVALVIFSLVDLDYRFITEPDEGEFSMIVIALLCGAAILWSTAAIGSTGQRGRATSSGVEGPAAAMPRRHSSLGSYLRRVLWSTKERRMIVGALAIFYATAMVVGIANGNDSGGFSSPDLGTLAMNGAVAALAAVLARRAASRTLKAGLWVVSAIFVLFLLLATRVESLVFAVGLHASIAFAALAASAAAADAASSPGKGGYTLLTVAATLAWIVLALFGLAIFLIAASGYES